MIVIKLILASTSLPVHHYLILISCRSNIPRECLLGEQNMINFEDTLPASNTKGYFTKVSIGVKVVVLAGELFFLGSHGKLRTKRIKALYQPPKLSLFFTPNSAMKKKNGFAEQTKSLRSHFSPEVSQTFAVTLDIPESEGK
jgi:hypothetical protein